MPIPKSVALLSGGLDSCVALASAREDSDVLMTLSIYYGQKHSRELRASAAISEYYEIPHTEIDTSDLGKVLSELHASALIDKTEALPHDRRMSEMTAKVPRSYVPGRNTIMLALAQSVAEALNCDQIYCGFNAVDFSGYPDCRPIFVDAWNHLARYATSKGYYGNPIQLVAPIINSSKASVVEKGLELEAPLHLTWSCYTGGDKPCGTCDSCIIRYHAFRENNISDPTGPYLVEPIYRGL